MHQPDLAFADQRKRALALPEPCGYCHAETGEPCVIKKTGQPLNHVPAHLARLKLIGLSTPVVMK